MMHTPQRLRAALVLGATLAALAIGPIEATDPSDEYPLEPPDRSSPRATLDTFRQSIDEAWKLYTAKDPKVREVFARARGCLDVTDVPPLVLDQVSAEGALLLKEVLDRIELPPESDIPDSSEVAANKLTRWTIPHTEITLVKVADGDQEGEWLFSSRTVARASEFYEKVKALPYQPGRLGGHLEELRSGTDATLIGRLVRILPPSARTRIGDMLAWQWGALGLLVLILVVAAFVAAWVGYRWSTSGLMGARLGAYLFPMMLIATPFLGRVMIRRLFQLPGEPALWVRIVLSVVGSAGLAWLVAVLMTRAGIFIVDRGFRDARPLKKQLLKLMFRVATIVVVTGIAVKALQSLGVPVAGLIAGLGVGGLAIALAAQGTLENFIGGIILYADQPVKVGDLCTFADRRGVVEDVGLRSVKIRTLDRTIVTIPNAEFAKLHLENLAERDRILLRENLRIPLETPRDRLQALMSELESMLRSHERLSEERLRVRLMQIREYYHEVEIYAYAMTDAWPEFLEIREDVLLKVVDIVERSGTRLALPTGVRYVSTRTTAAEPSGTIADTT
jgi:MscS family membrane protein